ncbi:HD-GYP domain-containing protein [Bacillus sp. DTU_2020_1000418_1_SI_GHA_SEK_038]|uniref:HD-GYP domain-containing protein n=1 Tax=Bacillus sp. DTU_2020_1000418_1_SI_GHA_SEK_038 TaxID=3077585 RepID=UPI0028ED6C56|nr:HD-GYP domain-containing protein [Bacillus sp. DTU_2020_1000418_1_SI_GHA_SEK_038]WNS74849.1 HD-GYP domain-containing protein [Bacillus sp. DTU_2020_1000418_1_SI_GHA_SEK_038]
MRLVGTASVDAGTILAKAIYNEKGQILLNKGIILKDSMIQRLQDLGITYIFIKDSETEDIEYEGTLSDSMRREAIQTICSTFQEIQNDLDITNSFVVEQASKRFSEIIRYLLTEIKEKSELLNLIADAYTYDNYIFTHSLNVTLYSLAIGMELRLSTKELEILGLGAIFHDIGKLKVSLDILLKPEKLTDIEYEAIKQHADEGFQILRKVHTIPLLVAHCAYQHHERLNGTGYPRGLLGPDIHYFGKIIAVADVFDAITSNRVYRKAMLPSEALEVLYAGSGSLFDQKVVEAFRLAVAIYPVGLSVVLNDGRKGIVSGQNTGLGDRPHIRIMEHHGEKVIPYDIDLKQELNVIIISCDTAFK